LSNWLADLESGSARASELAMKAVRAIGTNSFPALQRMLQATDPSWKKGLMDFNARQSLIQIRLLPASVIRYRAVEGYRALGAAAKQQVSALILMLESESNAEVRSDIAAALGEIGPEAKPAIPALMKAAQDPNQTLRFSAVFALANIQRFSPSELLDSPSGGSHRF